MGALPPFPFIAEEGQPAPPTITGNDGFPCMSQGLVKAGSCRGSMGKQRRPRPINRHASTEAACFWGPRRSVLDLWLRLEAKPERALGPGLLSAFWERGPQTCLPAAHGMAMLAGRTSHLHRQGIQDPREGPSLARGTMQDLLGSGQARKAHEERRYQGGANLTRLS